MQQQGRVWVYGLDGELQFSLADRRGSVNSVQFSPDGRWILTSSSGSARLWPARIERLLELAETLPARDFTPAELERYRELLDR